MSSFSQLATGRSKLGPCLECSSFADERRCRETAGAYRKHIRAISRGWPHLRYLTDFMTVSTVPLRYSDLSAAERQERANRVNISVVEYGDELSSTNLKTPDELDEFLSCLSDSEVSQKSRLILVQDLSTCMIEKLGAAFDIEPGFTSATMYG